MTLERLPASDLFAEPEVCSFPRRLVELRRLYAKAKAAYDAASEHEDDSGEQIPWEIKVDLSHWQKQLQIEEKHVAWANSQDQRAEGHDQK